MSGPIKIKHKGALTSLGYFLNLADGARQKGVDRAERKYGFAETERMLNVQVVLRKNDLPGSIRYEQKKKLLRDLDYLRARYGG